MRTKTPASTLLALSLSTIPLLSHPAAAQSAAVTTKLELGQACYDQARQRLTVFTADAVWDWDGTRWGRLGTATPPGLLTSPIYAPWERRIFGMDPARELVAFDGHAFESFGTFPGGAITRLVADPIGERILVVVLSGLQIELWQWDGTWQQAPNPPGSGLLLHQSFDEARNVLVVQRLVTVPFGYETLEWDGTAWSIRTASGTNQGTMVYDAQRGQVISLLAGEIRGWDGTAWSSLGMVPGAPPTTFLLTPAPAEGAIYGFSPAAAGQDQAIRIEASGAQRLPAVHPELVPVQITFDDSRGRAIALGNRDYLEFDGERWQQIPAAGPTPRFAAAQVYDAARQHTLLFGGFDGNSRVSGDTWAWDGRVWTQLAVAGPSPRSVARVAYDSARQRVVLVGGRAPGSSGTIYLDDHWEWDGQTWTRVFTNTPMSPVATMMGYDPVRARTVLHDNQGDTWVYNGSLWSRAAQTGLSPFDSQIVWNAGTQRLQATLGDPQLATEDEYEWDGTSWTRIGAALGQIVYDTTRGALYEYTADAMRVFGPSLAATANYGSACGGTDLGTSLTTFGMPRPGTRGLHLDLRADATLRPAVIGFGSGRANVPLGQGCALQLQNAFTAGIWFTDQHGVLQQPVALPNDASLRGYAFTAQGAVLDPMSPGGLAVSQGVELVVGL